MIAIMEQIYEMNKRDM